MQGAEVQEDNVYGSRGQQSRAEAAPHPPQSKTEVTQYLFLLFLPPRSHPTILDIPNRLYYDGELQACADVVDRERFCHWEGLPRKVRLCLDRQG